MERIKRLGRYLKGKPRLVQWFEWRPAMDTITTYGVVDWVGCKATRKSTSGGCVTIGRHTIKTWSKTQSFIALSSGESELYAALRAAAEIMGILSIGKDFGWELRGEAHGDASAALGVIHRQGFGKTRYTQAALLWVQEIVAEKRLNFGKVWGKENPADFFTKHLDEPSSLKHTATLKFDFTTGRAIDVPNLHILSQSWHEVISGGNYQEWKRLQFITNGRKETSLGAPINKFLLRDVGQTGSTTHFRINGLEKCDS